MVENMQVVFRLAYSLFVALLVVLFVVLGTRTFFSEPDYPVQPPSFGPGLGKRIVYCETVDVCYIDSSLVTPEIEATFSDDERELLHDQRAFAERRKEYEEDRQDHFRGVFLIAMVFGVAAVGVGLLLYRRVEAMPLGLLLGGVGALIFGWVEWARGPEDDDVGTAPLFVAVGVGLAIVLGAGYRVLGRRGEKDGG